jgi:hypothetical protein
MATSTSLSKEKKTIEAVCKYERAKGGRPERGKQGSGYDIASRGRKIEIKTIPRLKTGFVVLGKKQFQTLCEDKKFWIYLVDISGRQPNIFEFSRNQVLSHIRPYIHYDFLYYKQDLIGMLKRSPSNAGKS